MSGLSRRSYIYAGLEGTIRGRNTVCPRIDVKCIFRMPLLSYASSGSRNRDLKDDTRASFSLSLSFSLYRKCPQSQCVKIFTIKIVLCALNPKNSAIRVLFLFFFFTKGKKFVGVAQ